MSSEEKESTWSKIFVGILIGTIPAIILYFLGISNDTKPKEETKPEAKSNISQQIEQPTIDYSKYVGIYEGTTLNTSLDRRTGDTYFDINEIDNSTQKVKINASWSNGLTGEGRLFGNVKDYKIEVQGKLYSSATGNWDIDMEIFLHNESKIISGSYKIYPHVGNSNGTQYGQFTLTKTR